MQNQLAIARKCHGAFVSLDFLSICQYENGFSRDLQGELQVEEGSDQSAGQYPWNSKERPDWETLQIQHCSEKVSAIAKGSLWSKCLLEGPIMDKHSLVPASLPCSITGQCNLRKHGLCPHVGGAKDRYLVLPVNCVFHGRFSWGTCEQCLHDWDSPCFSAQVQVSMMGLSSDHES